MDLIQYHECVEMDAFRRNDLPMYLAGAAAVCSVVSIAAMELLLGAALALLLVWIPLPHGRGSEALSEPRPQGSGLARHWHIPPVWLPLVVFFALTIVSLLASGHIEHGFPQVKKFYVYAMLFVAATAFSNVRQIRWVAFGWTLAASASAALALNQFYNKYEDALDAHQDFYKAYVASRITGFMSHWMTFSGEMMMALMIIGALVFFSSARRVVKAIVIAAALLIGTALLLAETRSMWLGAGLGAAYLIWFWRRWVLIAIPVLAAIVVLVNPFELGNRITSAVRPHGELDSNAHRAMCRAIGWQMIKAHPWLGVGPEQVGPRHLNYLPPGTKLPLPEGYYGHLHSIYFQYAAERGVPAMLALMCFLARALYDFLRALRRAIGEQRWILHAAVACTIAVMAGGFYEYNLNDSEVLGMYLAAIAFGYVAVRASVKSP